MANKTETKPVETKPETKPTTEWAYGNDRPISEPVQRWSHVTIYTPFLHNDEDEDED